MHAKKLFIGWTVVLIAVAGLWIGPNLQNSRIQIMGLGGGGTTSAPDTVRKAAEADVSQNEDNREDAAFEMEFEPMMYSRGMPSKYYKEEVKAVASKDDSKDRKSKNSEESTEIESEPEVSTSSVVSRTAEPVASDPKMTTK